jgi:hypothetical protein
VLENLHKYDLISLMVWARNHQAVETVTRRVFDLFTQDGLDQKLGRHEIASYTKMKRAK